MHVCVCVWVEGWRADQRQLGEQIIVDMIGRALTPLPLKKKKYLPLSLAICARALQFGPMDTKQPRTCAKAQASSPGGKEEVTQTHTHTCTHTHT